MQKYVTNCIPISKRIVIIQLSKNPLNINLIKLYTPTCDANDVGTEQFNHTISEISKKI